MWLDVGACTMAPIQKSEDNFWELVLSFSCGFWKSSLDHQASAFTTEFLTIA